jgi:hypothetical protein
MVSADNDAAFQIAAAVFPITATPISVFAAHIYNNVATL